MIMVKDVALIGSVLLIDMMSIMLWYFIYLFCDTCRTSYRDYDWYWEIFFVIMAIIAGCIATVLSVTLTLDVLGVL